MPSLDFPRALEDTLHESNRRIETSHHSSEPHTSHRSDKYSTEKNKGCVEVYPNRTKLDHELVWLPLQSVQIV